MKRLAPIVLAALLAAPAFATPDVSAAKGYLRDAEQSAQVTAAQLAAANGERDALKLAFAGATDASKAKDETIAELRTEKKKAEDERDAAQSLGTRVKVLVLIGLGAALTLMATVSFLSERYRPAGVCGAGAVILFTASSVVARKDDIIATYGLIGGLVLMAAVGIYAVIEIFHASNGGVDLANAWEQFKISGKLTAEQIAQGNKTFFQETGAAGDRFWRWATGKTQKELAKEASTPTPPAPSITVPIAQNAVLSGVSLTPAGA